VNRGACRESSDKGAARIVIATDQSRQASNAFGMVFIHGGGAGKKGWSKNNLYGDGHAENLRPDQLVHRWGQPAAAANW
jgi:hypothetical protein